MPIEYLQIVSVPVRNQDQAKDFYVHSLGWDPRLFRRFEAAKYITYSAGDSTVSPCSPAAGQGDARGIL
jgi:predicted enzyme related to lactoylglutathione lyase